MAVGVAFWALTWPINLDIHRIPANTAKAEPEHWHFDFRYLYRIEESSVQLQAEEVGGHAWHPHTEIPQERLAQKLARVLGD